jgi:hypothetical protein
MRGLRTRSWLVCRACGSILEAARDRYRYNAISKRYPEMTYLMEQVFYSLDELRQLAKERTDEVARRERVADEKQSINQERTKGAPELHELGRLRVIQRSQKLSEVPLLKVRESTVRFRPGRQEGTFTLEGLLDCGDGILVALMQDECKAATLPVQDSSRLVEFPVLNGHIGLKPRKAGFGTNATQQTDFGSLCRTLLISPGLEQYGYVFSAQLQLGGRQTISIGFDDHSYPESFVEFLFAREPDIYLHQRQQRAFSSVSSSRDAEMISFWQWRHWRQRHRHREQEADRLASRKREDEAVELWERNCREECDSTDTHYSLASAYRRRGQINDEIRVLERARWIWENVHTGACNRQEALEELNKRIEEANKLRTTTCYYCRSEYEADGVPFAQRMFCSEACRRAWLACDGMFETPDRHPRYSKRRMDDSLFGWFYVIQLLPKAAPNRVKMGWTKDVPRRMQTYKVICPLARLLRKWPCHLDDERLVISLLTDGYGCSRIGYSAEVFDIDAVDNLLERCDRLIERWQGK